jgi:hypothetical protein
MGDRTNVYFSVLREHNKDALRIVGEKPSEYDVYGDKETTTHLYYDINWGELFNLHELRNQGIPYTSEWCEGSEYRAGAESVRYTANGEMEIKTIYDNERNPTLSFLLEVIDNPEALKRRILEHQKLVTVLPWTNQLEYSNLFKINQLISAN